MNDNELLITTLNESDSTGSIKWKKAIEVLSNFLKDSDDIDNQCELIQAYIEMSNALLFLMAHHGYMSADAAEALASVYNIAAAEALD